MTTSTTGSYTAKLVDGPLEGKTIATAFVGSADPQPRLAIPGDGGRRYVYLRTAEREFATPDDDRPSAVSYRFVETVFD